MLLLHAHPHLISNTVCEIITLDSTRRSEVRRPVSGSTHESLKLGHYDIGRAVVGGGDWKMQREKILHKVGFSPGGLLWKRLLRD